MNVNNLMDLKKNDKIYLANVQKEETFNLKLAENPSTGYKWMVKPQESKNCVKLVDSDFKSDPNPMNLMGVGGSRVMKFEATGEAGCSERFRMIEIQPWAFPGWDKYTDDMLTVIEFTVAGGKQDKNLNLSSLSDLKKEDNVYLYTAEKNESFGLKLSENPSTGYKW